MEFLYAWTIIISVGFCAIMLLGKKYKHTVYIICPVRNKTLTTEQKNEIEQYVAKLEQDGFSVHYPPRDVDQNDPTGVNIVNSHRRAMQNCWRVDIFWDAASMGSHFDLGMAMALGKKLHLVRAYQPDVEGKSFLKVIEQFNR